MKVRVPALAAPLKKEKKERLRPSGAWGLNEFKFGLLLSKLGVSGEGPAGCTAWEGGVHENEATTLGSDEWLVCGIHPSRLQGREGCCQVGQVLPEACRCRTDDIDVATQFGADS